jgi:hypothetical protein
LLYRTNALTCQSSFAQQQVDFIQATDVETEWEWDFTRNGILPPGAEIYWQWEINDAEGNILLTDEQTFVVNDPRQTWNHLSAGQIYMQWYQGNLSFGQSLLEIASQSLKRLSDQAGIRPTGRIWITVYPSVEELQTVDIHTTEWAGGLAYPTFNSTIVAISPDELLWAGEVIPHEIGHLVTESIVFNCRGMWLPTWLDEGLAMYAEGSIPQGYMGAVITALKHNKLPPLRSLERGFSSDAETALISYGQSGMVVTYLLEQYSSQKMADLLAAIQSGLVINKALQAIYGIDTDGMDAEWRISLGYEPQPTLPPASPYQTTVPTLALWTSVIQLTNTPTSLPTITPMLPKSTVTPIPPPSQSPTLPVDSNTIGDTESAGQSHSSTAFLWIFIPVIIILLGGISVSLFLIRRKRRTSS